MSRLTISRIHLTLKPAKRRHVIQIVLIVIGMIPGVLLLGHTANNYGWKVLRGVSNIAGIMAINSLQDDQVVIYAQTATQLVIECRTDRMECNSIDLACGGEVVDCLKARNPNVMIAEQITKTTNCSRALSGLPDIGQKVPLRPELPTDISICFSPFYEVHAVVSAADSQLWYARIERDDHGTGLAYLAIVFGAGCLTAIVISILLEVLASTKRI